jgi:hypothetical protein
MRAKGILKLASSLEVVFRKMIALKDSARLNLPSFAEKVVAYMCALDY